MSVRSLLRGHDLTQPSSVRGHDPISLYEYDYSFEGMDSLHCTVGPAVLRIPAR